MPRNYKRTTDRQSWSEVSMKKAIEAVKNKEMGWLLAAKTFGIPHTTLRRHALDHNKMLKPNFKGLGRYKQTFPPEVERQFVEHLKFLETRLFGLTRTSVQELAFQLAEKNGFSHTFNKEKEKAGQEWLEGFLRRNKDISLRKPEATSAARAQAFNKPQVKNFFKIYQDLVETRNILPHKIYNADESGLSTVQKPQKILATTGRKQVGCITSAERGSNVTVVCCMSAGGFYIPPALIFPRKNMKIELIDGAPAGTLGIAQESGWMNTEVFLKWLKHFQTYAKATVEDKVILIVDGHASHKGIDALNFAKENGIEMICLPPHCTHRMQPLDVCFYGPLKTYFNQEISKWLRCHPGRVVTHFQISSLFNEAYGKTATIQNACHGFKTTGLWPVNPDIFPDYMFAPAETTNISIEQETPGTAAADNNSSEYFASNDSNATAPNLETVPETRDLEVESQLLPFKEIPGPSSSSLAVPLDVLSPVPKGKFISGQGKRKPKTQKSHTILTSTPNMQEIKNKAPKNPPKTRKSQVKKNLFDSESDEEPFETQTQDEVDDCACIYCNDLYSRSKPGEGWLRCMHCSLWAHAECADLPKRTKKFICALCV